MVHMSARSRTEATPLQKAKTYPSHRKDTETPRKFEFARQRKCSGRVRSFQRGLRLLFSPRTMVLQLTSWIFIAIVTNVPWMKVHFVPLGTTVDVRIVVMIMSFAIIFSIDHSFQRRERTLQDIARFQSNLTTIYYGLHSTKNVDIYKEVNMLMEYMVHYMTDNNPLRDSRLQSERQKECMHGFYDIAYTLFDQVQFPGKWPKEAMMNQQIQSLIESFERICATKGMWNIIGLHSLSISLMIAWCNNSS